jgi:hypothetical protein
LSVRRQCELLELNRSSFSYEPAQADPEDTRLMARIDRLHPQSPFFGSRKLAVVLSTPKAPESVSELERGLRDYFGFSNQRRIPQSLDYRTPAEVHRPENRRPLER